MFFITLIFYVLFFFFLISPLFSFFFFFFFNDTATTEIYTLSLHDALPIYVRRARVAVRVGDRDARQGDVAGVGQGEGVRHDLAGDRDLGRGRGLLDVEPRALDDRDGVVVGVGTGLGRIGRDGVVEVTVAAAVRIDLGLGDGVVAGVGPGLADLELAVGVGVAGDVRRARVAVRVGDRDARQGDVAGVGQGEGVRHDLAGDRDLGRGRGLLDVEGRTCDHDGVAVIAAAVVRRGDRGGVLDRAAVTGVRRPMDVDGPALAGRQGRIGTREDVGIGSRVDGAAHAGRVARRHIRGPDDPSRQVVRDCDPKGRRRAGIRDGDIEPDLAAN